MVKVMYSVRDITDLRQMLRSSVDLFGDKAAFLQKEDGEYAPISFNKFKRDVDALGTALWDKGLHNQKIVLIGENCYEWAVSYMAVVCGLGVIVPVDKELPEEEINNLIKISGAKAVICNSKVEQYLLNQKNIMVFNLHDDIYSLIDQGRRLLKKGQFDYIESDIDPDAMSILLFTSGTTGVSKGVMLSHRNICENLKAMCSMIYIGPEDIFLSVLPLHHTYECTCGFLCQIYRGCTIAYCEGLRHVAKNLKEVKATIMLGVPLLMDTLYNRIWQQAEKTGRADKLRSAIKLNNKLKKVKIDLSKVLFKSIHEAFGGHLKFLISGGAALDPKTASGLRDLGIKVIQGYGLTECSPIAALNTLENYRDDAAGLPLPGVTLDIVDKNDEGIGEIVVKGPNVMLGYFNNPELTAEVIKDGFYHTGDLGYIDDQGFLYITGRKKNVIVTKNGKNIFPEELETYLARNMFVKESVVCGVFNEKKNDFDIVAVVVPDDEKLAEVYGEGYTDEDVTNNIKNAVAETNKIVQSYKKIDLFIIRREEFEKTTTKKIKRFALGDIISNIKLGS